MGTEDLITEAMLATSPLEPAPALLPVDAPWALPVRAFFNRFRRRRYEGVPLFFTDGLSPKEARAFRGRHPDLSLVFAYYTLGRETVALIWHPRYEVVRAIDGLVRFAAAINPHSDAMLAEGQGASLLIARESGIAGGLRPRNRGCGPPILARTPRGRFRRDLPEQFPREARRAAERLDYSVALRAFDREAAAIWGRARSYPTWLREQIERLAIANGEAWLRRQLEGLG